MNNLRNRFGFEIYAQKRLFSQRHETREYFDH